MNRTSRHTLLCASLIGTLLAVVSPFARAQWTQPTPEELSMTSQPEVPGASAVYLYREETTDDQLHMFSTYVRLKVLTERGKEFSNVELGYATVAYGGSSSITDIQGRTIHPDGTIIPFTGKPYEKLVQKTQNVKVMSKVFTLPDVEVGSIIEYRYKFRLDDDHFSSPDWYIQSDLYTRKAHYEWKPTDKQLISSDDRGQLTSGISWTRILPPGMELKVTETPGTTLVSGRHIFDLDVHDVAPAPSEEFMPPLSNFTYRVLFYYTPYRTGEEYWKNEGKHWAKVQDKFIGPNSGVKAAVNDLTSPSDSQDQKLHKLYAAVMRLENTDYTREHSNAEERSEGLKEVHNTDDIWARKRGSDDQLTELFVAMARAAGMKAYVMAVTSRDRRIFFKGYPSLSQLDALIAIVNVDGKEQFFDPGSRYCPYQHLEWKHTMVNGLRQTDDGSEIVATPGESYTYSRTERVADLNLDQQGAVTGTVKMTYKGAPALTWRQRSLTGDATSLENELRTHMEGLLPQGLQITVGSIDNLTEYEQPLTVHFVVKGEVGSSTGKRLLLPADVFEANAKPSFSREKRETPVAFSYPSMVLDAVRFNFPATLNVESAPSNDKISLHTFAAYEMSTASTATSITTRRNYLLGEILFMTKDYPELRSFYSKMETKDQESVVLTTAPAVASKVTPTGN
jgi:hypothetical protein